MISSILDKDTFEHLVDFFLANYITIIQVILHSFPVWIALKILFNHYINPKELENNIDKEKELHKTTYYTLILLCWLTVNFLFVTLINVRNIQESVRSTSENLGIIALNTNYKQWDKNLVKNGTNEIYPDVEKELKSRKFQDSLLVLDILGFTLRSTEPKFVDWQDKGYLKNIRINLYYLDEEFLSNDTCMDKKLCSILNYNINSIESFKAENESVLRQNKVEINLLPYRHIPAVHGFNFNNGTCFISFASWLPNCKIDQPTLNDFIKIYPDNNSETAISLINTFNNWRDAAKNDYIKISKKLTNESNDRKS